ncbi:6-phosphogluconolactonase [Hoyosella sp. YIM 151337]|uniref:6-phosphogluconolactonase n=1 Tax=Hoyosella sp. YIM 151337 TaxID=2992742 RepID=UPI0022354F24|nr:6-phosphogluconolactonase [Hoyosella sp. YIM 151337]MCW4353178.1 6-phosphogluconolactonase [Hoyosella sp. YIM 151337]
MNSASQPPEVLVFDDGPAVASAVAERLTAAIAGAQQSRGIARIAITGGSLGIAALRALRSAADRVEWNKLEIFWGDERFLPAGHDDRNDAQADEALLKHVPVDAARIFRMPSLGDGQEPGTAPDVDSGAAAYERTLRSLTADGSVPQLDVHLLGMGPDGHINSLFPGKANLSEQEKAVAAEHDSPKPPPERITLTYPVVNNSRQVWFVVAGEDKAGKVAQAVRDGMTDDCPAAGAHGRDNTIWFLDKKAAELLR